MGTDRVLIVDDEIDVLGSIGRAFKLAGFRVFLATGATQALKTCDEEQIDAVVLDFIMPEMKGIELLARIRRRCPHVRAVIVSGKIDKNTDPEKISGELREAVEADRYFHKPVNNNILVDAVRELISKKGNSSRDWRSLAGEAIKAAEPLASALDAERKFGRLAKKVRRGVKSK